MKLPLVLFALIFTAFSCNTKINEEDNIPTSKTELLTTLSEIDDTVKSETDVKTETVSTEISLAAKPLLIARGSEPGWYAEFFKDHLRLLLNYGKDSVFVENDFTNIIKEETYNVSFTKVSPLSIIIDMKPCTEEASGDKKERTISLKYKGNTYKGCASIH